MGRLLIYNPEIKKNTVLHFNYTKAGSWKLRDYSSGTEKEIGSNQNSNLTVEEILKNTKWQDQANSSISVKDHNYWKNVIAEYNSKLSELIENDINEEDPPDPFDFAINNYSNELIEKAKRLPRSSQIKLDPVNIINNVFEIEKIAIANHSAALDPANTILKILAADICERQGISNTNDFFENLKLLERNGILTEKALHYFHFIRQFRNMTVHQHIENKTDINANDTRLVRFMLLIIINCYLELFE